MLKSEQNRNEELEEKLEYLGLNLKKIPEEITKFEPIQYKASKMYNKKQQYKQYRFIRVKDIQILLTPTNRMDDLQEKYKKAVPLANYLDSKSEENMGYYATFLNMLDKFRLNDVKKIEKEQKKLAEKVPFRVKFEGNYLWQIYYSDISNQYFMLVPTEDTDYSTFFYLLKRKIENRDMDTVFVPISNLNYSKKFFSREELEDIENYLWLFTKDWPLIYEVYDKQNRFSLQIVGETNIFDDIRSPYRINLKTTVSAMQFYKLLKAMFILETEMPNYYNFVTKIDRAGGIEFYLDDQKLEYITLSTFIKNEYIKREQEKEEMQIRIKQNKVRLEELKSISKKQELEYLEKEKQISTFLECKKSFFGKFKYYFKYSKKGSKNKIRKTNEINQELEEEIFEPQIDSIEDSKKGYKKDYTLEELVEKCKELENVEVELKNILMDINAIKLKNKNMAKKIENATAFIQEIDNHKKSIFEFWKYSNKDEMTSLPEGEEEEVNVIKKITKIFNFREDLEKFGIELDKWQRKNLTKEELDSCYIATTDLIEILNKVKTNNILPKSLEINLKDLKKSEKKEKEFSESDEFDIFGGLVEDNRKIRKINDKRHREVKKDEYNILEINETTKSLGYKLSLEKVLTNIKSALEKEKMTEEIPVYKAQIDERIQKNTLQLFDVDAQKEMQKLLDSDSTKLYFYKINLTEGTSAIGITNSVLYDNQNKTLPLGMDLSTQFLVDIGKLPLVLKKKSVYKLVDLNKEDEFSDAKLRSICLLEYELDEEKRLARKLKKKEEKKEVKKSSKLKGKRKSE